MNKIILFIFFISLSASCNNNYENVKILNRPLQSSQYLYGESLGLKKVLGSIGNIYCFDSLLFFRETADDLKMLVCNPEVKEILNRLIPIGRGPGEQIGTFFFTYRPSIRKLYSFDITLRKILELDLDSISQPGYKPIKSYPFPSSLRVLHGTNLGDSLFVVSGNFNDCRVAIFSLDGTVRKFGICPDIKSKHIDEIINQAYLGEMKAHPSGERFVLACEYADQLEIFNVKDSTQLFVKGPELFEPIYKVEKMGSYSVLTHPDDEINGYIDVAVTAERIYALYFGKPFSEGGGLYANVIRVFSWEGEYLMDYILDRGVSCFCFNENNACFYGVTSEPGAEIYKFNLN